MARHLSFVLKRATSGALYCTEDTMPRLNPELFELHRRRAELLREAAIRDFRIDVAGGLRALAALVRPRHTVAPDAKNATPLKPTTHC